MFESYLDILTDVLYHQIATSTSINKLMGLHQLFFNEYIKYCGVYSRVKITHLDSSFRNSIKEPFHVLSSTVLTFIPY
jgi:hypothetical protein